MSNYKCPGCSQEFDHISSYLSHTKDCKILEQMHKDYEEITKQSGCSGDCESCRYRKIRYPEYIGQEMIQECTFFNKDDFFKPKVPDLDRIGSYIRVIKELKLRKQGICRTAGKDPRVGCPITCPNFEEKVPCDDPCALQYVIELLCDIAQDLINEEIK